MNKKPSESKCNLYSKAPAALVSSNNRYYLFHDVNVIGRSENAFICLQDSLISRKHCSICKSEDSKFTICDTSSSGTFVNDKKLVKNRVQELHHKDKISLGSQGKHTYIFVTNKNLNMSSHEQSEYLNTQLKKEIINLDYSHSAELMKLNKDLCKIDSEKRELQQEMNSKLKTQEDLFNAERLSLSNLVTSTQEQKDDAESKLKEMKDRFEIEEKKLKDELERKYANMVKKEDELQLLKIEMELQHQQDRKELEERCQAEIMELKLKLAMAEMEQDRLQEQTRDAQQQLAESKKVLLESEIEQTRLVVEKDEVETKLIDLTKESTQKDDIVMELKRKLEEKEKEEERVRKEVEKLEEHLMCSICAELFIEPIVLQCGHMFCKTCIDEWKAKKKMCPMCRAKISGCVQVYNLDSIIEKNVALLSAEAKEYREDLIRNRKKVSAHSKPSKKHRRRSERAASPYRRPADPIPQYMIPMVQINNEITFGNQRLGNEAANNRQLDLAADPFTWRTAEERRLPIVRMEVNDPVPQVDLTHFLEPNIPWRQNAAATSTSTNGLIDLTTP